MYCHYFQILHFGAPYTRTDTVVVHFYGMYKGRYFETFGDMCINFPYGKNTAVHNFFTSDY